MARANGGTQQWNDDDERLYAVRDSDDSPILLHRYEKHRKYAPYVCESKTEERERRSTFSVLAKFFLFSTAMILFCVLLYIPVYNKANDEVAKPAVAGWSIHTNRDTKIYVQPENLTTLHEPKDVCAKGHRQKEDKLLLLIIVCSSTTNFDQRLAIRETWGNHKNYLRLARIYHEVKEKYRHFNLSQLRETESTLSSANTSASDNTDRVKRDISGFGQLLPELAKALQNDVATADVEPEEEKRFNDEKEDDKMLPEFDMNKVLGDQDDNSIDYDYGSNIMKIPPRGYEDTPDLDKIISLLKHVKTFPKKETVSQPSNTAPDFKLLFLLGLPVNDNDTDVQEKIEAEVQKYGDVIQEGFIDSYNNLTLKSIMMLKWVTNNCNESVRYILKTDDDMYINVPSLVANLRSRAKLHDENVAKGNKSKEYLLIGDLICGARPVQDSKSKWYSPRYMYKGRVYPRYLSGTGYVMSAPTAHALYAAALRTSYFHLEDIYITGMCALRSTPRVVPRDDVDFSYERVRGPVTCAAHARVSSHRVPPSHMRHVHALLLQPAFVDKCEKLRLTQINKIEDNTFVLYKYLRLLITNSC